MKAINPGLLFLATLVLCLGLGQVKAQDEKEVAREKALQQERELKERKEKPFRHQGEIRTLSGDHYHSGGFGAVSFKGTLYQQQTLMMAGIRGGWTINRAISMGFEGWGFLPTAKLSGVTPLSDVVVIGGYGGFFLEPIVLSNQVVHLTFPVSGGAGWTGYHTDFYDINLYEALVDDDLFWYIEPGAALELNVSKGFRMDFGVSYRFTQDYDLISTPKDALDDWNYFLTLKFGRF